MYGHLITFGSNKFGQLGVGHLRDVKGMSKVLGPLMGKCIERVACGDGFTVCATAGMYKPMPICWVEV